MTATSSLSLLDASVWPFSLTARGKGDPLAPENLVRMSRAQSLFKLTDSRAWFNDPSARSIRLYAAELIGNEKRRNGDVLELTHFDESAIWIFNCGAKALSGQSKSEAAYVVYGHDLVEAKGHQGLTERQIVTETWQGAKDRIDYLVASLEGFNNTPHLTKAEKLVEQVKRAHAEHKEGRPLLALGLTGEKTVTGRRDEDNIRKDLMIFRNRDDADAYLQDYLYPRQWVVNNLPVEAKFKEAYSQLCARIERRIGEQLLRHDRHGVPPDKDQPRNYYSVRRPEESGQIMRYLLTAPERR